MAAKPHSSFFNLVRIFLGKLRLMGIRSTSQQVSMTMMNFIVFVVILSLARVTESRKGRIPGSYGIEYNGMSCRAHSASITEFGGVGDGKTSNTKAFQTAVERLSRYGSNGGALLYVPAGKWLTGSFSLTSHFTLFLHQDAILLAAQDKNEFPVQKSLPSYGRGRDAAGGRYQSLIFGTNLTDVIVTGHNGTIDGQGAFWWESFHKNKLKYTRPYLIEFMFSDTIQISNITLLNSPTWNIHPVYSSNIVVQGVTIIAPVKSPNTDGINPDSCTNIRIEDCYVVSGDDCIAVKSGWDEYGIAFGMPTQHLIIRRLTCISPYSAAIALGSEMSGGISDVRAEDITAIQTESAVRIKTAVGRGGYVRDIHVRGMKLHTMKWVFWMAGNYKAHADSHYDPKALPDISGINFMNVVADDVGTAGRLEGIDGDPFKGICISNATIGMAVKHEKAMWVCTDVQGTASGVTPPPCNLLSDQGQEKVVACNFPMDVLPIDIIKLKECSS